MKSTAALKRVLVAAAAGLLISACSSAPQPDAAPAWIAGPSARYPAASYITGRGVAPSSSLARDRARADLAKVFAVRISGHSSDVAGYAKTGSHPARNTLELRRRISTETNQLLHGVRIADTWRSPRSGKWYALAVLSRSRTGAALRQRIGELDAATRAHIERARGSDGLLVRIAAARQAVLAQSARTLLERKLRVVSMTGRGVPAAWSLARLRSDYAGLLARIRVSARGRGSHARKLERLLAGALAQAGFRVRRGAPYTATAILDYHTLPPRNGWYWITGTLAIALDGKREAHGVKRWPLKVSATDPVLARQRLMDNVAHILDSHIRQAVLSFAGGDEPGVNRSGAN